MQLLPMPTQAPFDEALLWTKIGAIGSWAGSFFGLLAFIISICALWLPQRVRIKASISSSFAISQLSDLDKVKCYSVNVRNLSTKPVMINNVYLNFGGPKEGKIFVGMLNKGTIMAVFDPKFPIRLDPGSSFNYMLMKDKLDIALEKTDDSDKDARLFILVDEVTKGEIYCKTKWTRDSFR